MVVILVVLTTSVFRFSLVISQLLAKAIPVRGAKFERPAFRAGFLLLWVTTQTRNENHRVVLHPAVASLRRPQRSVSKKKA